MYQRCKASVHYTIVCQYLGSSEVRRVRILIFHKLDLSVSPDCYQDNDILPSTLKLERRLVYWSRRDDHRTMSGVVSSQWVSQVTMSLIPFDAYRPKYINMRMDETTPSTPPLPCILYLTKTHLHCIHWSQTLYIPKFLRPSSTSSLMDVFSLPTGPRVAPSFTEPPSGSKGQFMEVPVDAEHGDPTAAIALCIIAWFSCAFHLSKSRAA